MLRLQVDGEDLRNATHDKAVETIRNASNPVKFVVQSLTDPACVSSSSCLMIYLQDCFSTEILVITT